MFEFLAEPFTFGSIEDGASKTCKIFFVYLIFKTYVIIFLAGPFTFSPDQVGSQKQIVILTTSKKI